MSDFEKTHSMVQEAIRQAEENASVRKVVRQTDILCNKCGKANFNVEEPGSETSRWLRCPNCDQYYYVIHGILCVDVIMVQGKNLSKETVERELAK